MHERWNRPWWRRLLYVDQRPAKRDCRALIDALPTDGTARNAGETRRCVDAVLDRLRGARIEGRPHRDRLRALLLSQLEAGNASGARRVIDGAVPDEAPSWPLIAPLAVATGALLVLALAPYTRIIGRLLLLFVAGIGLSAVVVVVTALLAVRRFNRRYPHAGPAGERVEQIGALIDAGHPELARAPYDELRALADAHPDEAQVLRTQQMRAALDLARALGDADSDDAAELYADVRRLIDADPPDAALPLAMLALGELAGRMGREQARAAIALLRDLSRTNPSHAWIYDSARRKVDWS